MDAAIGLRADYTGADLWKAAKVFRDTSQVRRLRGLEAVYGTASRRDAASVGDGDRRTARG